MASPSAAAKVPESGFFAVRRGVGVRACIFLHWSDCWGYLPIEHPIVEYKVFDDVQDALQYIKEGGSKSTPAAKRKAVPVAASEAKRSRKTSTTSRSTTAAAVKQKASPAVASTGPRKAATIRSTTDAADHEVNKMIQWESNFSELKSYMESHDNKWVEPYDCTTASKRRTSKRLTSFVKELQRQYALYEGGDALSSTLSEERIKLLQDIGFVFVSEWEKSFDAFKAYGEANGGEWVEIDKDDAENKSLRRWITHVKYQYERFDKGEKHFALTQERIDRLKAAGFQFDYISWSDRVEQVKSFKAEHGNLNIPEVGHELSKWIVKLRGQYKQIREGKLAKDLTAARLAELSELGLHWTKESQRKAKTLEAYHVEFEEMLPQLQQYQSEHGNCRVPEGGQHKELAKWLDQQKRECSKLRKGDEKCRMTANHLQQLTTAGFQIPAKSCYVSWDDRIQELKDFREAHGHLDVSLKHPSLGSFIGICRKQYKSYKQGERSTLTEEKIQQLDALDFKWNVERWVLSPRPKFKTWEERFQELVEFIEEEGHSVVPQMMPGLGGWVHTQRKEMKKLRLGRKSCLTTEKALKLTGVGFVVDAFEVRRRTQCEG